MTCRTVEEAAAAGTRDGLADPPPTEELVIYAVRLLGRDRTVSEAA